MDMKNSDGKKIGKLIFKTHYIPALADGEDLQQEQGDDQQGVIINGS